MLDTLADFFERKGQGKHISVDIEHFIKQESSEAKMVIIVSVQCCIANSDQCSHLCTSFTVCSLTVGILFWLLLALLACPLSLLKVLQKCHTLLRSIGETTGIQKNMPRIDPVWEPMKAVALNANNCFSPERKRPQLFPWSRTSCISMGVGPCCHAFRFTAERTAEDAHPARGDAHTEANRRRKQDALTHKTTISKKKSGVITLRESGAERGPQRKSPPNLRLERSCFGRG